MEKENGDERAKTMSSPERQRGEEKLGQTWGGGIVMIILISVRQDWKINV